MTTPTDPLAGAYDSCTLCPRRCRARRGTGHVGRCGAGSELRLARAAPHLWEEPHISGSGGSGAIFFVGCPLGCAYCQNAEISTGAGARAAGVAVSAARLAAIMCELEGAGCHNVNLVTPLHFAPQVREAVLRARAAGLSVPVIANTSGYETVETVRAVADVIDVWLTDYKYADAGLAGRCSRARDYPAVARAALAEMLRAVDAAGGRAEGADATLRRGVVVRHLLLPGEVGNACAVLDAVWELAGTERADVSVMNQYTPNAACRTAGGPLARAVTEAEYERVLDYADDLGFEHVWWQQGGTVDESFVPAWDGTGVRGAELAPEAAGRQAPGA